MSQSQTKTELLNLQSTAENQNTNKENSNSDQLVTQKEYGEGGIIIRSDSEGHFATIGEFRISEKFETEEILIEKLANKDYEILTNLIFAIVEYNEWIKKQ